MRHRRRTRKLGMKTAHREAMFRNMVTSLFEHGRITTTLPRAKELRRIADRMVTLAKRGDLHARRQALAVIRKKEVVARLFEEIGKQFKDRPGGYTRVLRIGPRRGDAAMMALVELAYESLRPKGRPSVERAEREETDVIPKAVSTEKEGETSSQVGEEEAVTETEGLQEETDVSLKEEIETGEAESAQDEQSQSESDEGPTDDSGEASSNIPETASGTDEATTEGAQEAPKEGLTNKEEQDK